jgi:asparaginyl-tRNA synthetase
MAIGKVYCFGPTFRAEKSKTRRHLTEFLDARARDRVRDLDDFMQLAEDMLCYVVKSVLERASPSSQRSSATLTKLEAIQSRPFPRISYDEAARSSRRRRVELSSTATTSARPTRRSCRTRTTAR